MPRVRDKNKEWVLMISFWSDRNVLKLDCGVAWQLSELIKIMKLHTLNKSVLWYICYNPESGSKFGWDSKGRKIRCSYRKTSWERRFFRDILKRRYDFILSVHLSQLSPYERNKNKSYIRIWIKYQYKARDKYLIIRDEATKKY